MSAGASPGPVPSMVAIAESMGSLVTVVATVTTDLGAANQIGIKKRSTMD